MGQLIKYEQIITFKRKVGETGLEPATSASQTQRSSHLNYSPNQSNSIISERKRGVSTPLKHNQRLKTS